MSMPRIPWKGLLCWTRIAERAGTFVLLASLSVMAVQFYLNACLSLAQLQQIGPEGLMRALSGL